MTGYYIYATDIVVGVKSDPAGAAKSAHSRWTNDWKFFTSNEKMISTQFNGDFSGVKLPKEAIDNIYSKNARKWLGIF